MKIQKNLSLATLTSWKTGGKAAAVFIPENKEELMEAVKIGKEAGNFYLLGNGTNVLAPEEGIPYPIIKLGKGFGKIEINGTQVTAGASASLIGLSLVCVSESLAGFEFASGIPGSVGGAVIMNAGAQGSEIKNVLVSVEAYDVYEEKFTIFTNSEMKYEYRNSLLKNNSRYIVVEAHFALNKGDEELLREAIKKNKEERLLKQPWEYPNAGSVFKNPPGKSAGKLIEDAGLKGFRINDAQISEKHGNFIVNRGNATSKDIINIIMHVEKVINEKYNINLEREIIILG
jgi:UDP-N-acetylmuramate dehydrogenase